MSTDTPLPRGNPFSTRYTRPGKLAFEFVAGESGAGILQRWADAGRCGAIVGPHGAGKSTLLAHLVAALRARGEAVAECALHDGQRRLPAGFPPPDVVRASGVLVVDGYEQLGWWARWRLARLARRRGCGLLITAHQSTSWPTLVELSPTPELAWRLVERLLPPGDATIGRDEVLESYRRHGGNLRALLFDLYDRYERHNRQ